MVLAPHSFDLDPRPGDSEVTFSVFESSAICFYQSNHLNVEATPLSAFPKDTSEFSSISSHYSCWTSSKKAV